MGFWALEQVLWTRNVSFTSIVPLQTSSTQFNYWFSSCKQVRNPVIGSSGTLFFSKAKLSLSWMISIVAERYVRNWNVTFNSHVESLVLETVLFMPISDSTMEAKVHGKKFALAKYKNWLLGFSLVCIETKRTTVVVTSVFQVSYYQLHQIIL